MATPDDPIGSPHLRPADLARPPAACARALLGCTLVRTLPTGEQLAGVIVETEAYGGSRDAASHSYRGRRTPRNESMYGPPGTAYVYFTYGMHFCFNVVCGRADEGVAVLVRALEPTAGIEEMRRRRSAHRRAGATSLRDRDLCSGPARLCQAFGVERSLDGSPLTEPGGTLRLLGRRAAEGGRGAPGPPRRLGTIGRSPRIGVAYAGAWAEKPRRWFFVGHPCVSR